MGLSACRWSEEDASLNEALRSYPMMAAEERSTLSALEAKRAVIRRELSQVDQEIRQTEQAQARIEARIKLLEQRPRQAA
jgi:hypothetical protein